MCIFIKVISGLLDSLVSVHYCYYLQGIYVKMTQKVTMVPILVLSWHKSEEEGLEEGFIVCCSALWCRRSDLGSTMSLTVNHILLFMMILQLFGT